MSLQLNRRQWLKTSAIAAAGLIVSRNYTACQRKDALSRLSLRGEEPIRLGNNESPYGISDGARQAIISSIDKSNRYPHGSYSQLKELIAERENVSAENIILGAGSTEVMTALIHVYGTQGSILVGDPTYFDFIIYASRARCPLQQVPLNDNFEHDLPAMEKRIDRDTRLIYICNPNNPTGSITPGEKLHLFCERASEKALVVVDEAYHEYVEDRAYASMIDLSREEKNVIVTRTFSKVFGLAGLRVGYGIARPDIIKELERMERNFAPVAWLSLMAAIASYKDPQFPRVVKQKNREVKSYLYGELEKLNLAYVPSHTNFVLFKVNQDSRKMAKDFERRSILIRPFEFKGQYWIRVSLGTMEEMKTFISVLKEIA
ncbi:MAG: histidinol-phosphate transaminase [Candidatus Aminicenantes bacterium]|nr:histidinol-phosphate transaminase [Candidatus Aminicenantes bacterium]